MFVHVCTAVEACCYIPSMKENETSEQGTCIADNETGKGTGHLRLRLSSAVKD